MSKAKFQAARELINDKQYEQARAILRTIDHPTAKQWIEKINAIAPEKPKKSSNTRRIVMLGFILSVLSILAAVVFFIFYSQLPSNRQLASGNIDTTSSTNMTPVLAISIPSDGLAALQARIESFPNNSPYNVIRSQRSTDPSEFAGMMLPDIPDELWCVHIDVPISVTIIYSIYGNTWTLENVTRFLISREGLLWNAVPSDSSNMLIAETGIMVYETETIQNAWLQAGCEW